MRSGTTRLVEAARETAADLLSGNSTRLRRTVGVVDTAATVVRTIDPADAGLLLAAAWLHDIGYARTLQQIGFHPLDGARYLESAGWPPRLCALVAFHSGAYYVAIDRGLAGELRHFHDEPGPVRDALTYADQTTGSTGEPVTFDQRIMDMLRRHGPDSPNARVHSQRGPYLRTAVDQVGRRLAGAELAPGRHRRD